MSPHMADQMADQTADQTVIQHLLERIYGPRDGDRALTRLMPLIRRFKDRRSKPGGSARRPAAAGDCFSARDVVLITYGNSLNAPGQAPLATLARFTHRHLKGIFSHVHILPFFPFSSDDGFSVTDFHRVNPELGSWADIDTLGRDFQLMFDLVLNHISAQSRWFRYYMDGRPGFENLAITADPAADLSAVVRPRTLPLLTEIEKSSGHKAHVWTTFSADQIDLNWASIDVLGQMVAVLLYYIKQGATMIRLDAVAYLWKQIGTSCIHLPQTHDMVRLLRAILDMAAPEVLIVTETNVPHAENISYFGNGQDEAQMVYNFTLPPLLLHTFLTGDARNLSRWATGLALKSERTTFFNFTASHDGIGVRPLEGIVEAPAMAQLLQSVQRNGGRISYKQNNDGTKSAYELNITYVDALRPVLQPVDAPADLQDTLHIQRFLCSQAIALALPGVAAVYIHSLLGSRNWQHGVAQTGHPRTINRQTLVLAAVEEALADPHSFRARVFDTYRRMIATRIAQPAFHPNASFEVLNLDPHVFALKRSGSGQTIFALNNVCDRPVRVALTAEPPTRRYRDLLGGETFQTRTIELPPFRSVWLV